MKKQKPRPKQNNLESNWTTRRWCLLIFLLAFAFRVETIFSSKRHTRVVRGMEMQTLAESLAQTGTFTNPFRNPTGPTAHLAPVYPLYLSALIRLFPKDGDYEMAKELLSALAASLQYALLPWLAVIVGWHRRVGLIAALMAIVMFALLPRIQQRLETEGTWEHTFSALGLVLLCIVSLKLTKHAVFSFRESALLGVSWGVLLLLTPPMAILFPAWMVIGFLGRGQRFGRFAALTTTCLLLTLAPWTLRNLLVFGKPIWGRGNLGLELQVSNNECAAADFLDIVRAGCHARMHPNVNPEVARQMLAAGEANYNQQLLGRAITWIAANPTRFLRLTAERCMLFWFPPLGKGAAPYLCWTLTMLGFLGVGLSYKTNRFAALWFGSVLAFFPIVYYLVQHFVRYRYPILWVTFLTAAFVIETILVRFSNPKGSNHNPFR